MRSSVICGIRSGLFAVALVFSLALGGISMAYAVGADGGSSGSVVEVGQDEGSDLSSFKKTGASRNSGVNSDQEKDPASQEDAPEPLDDSDNLIDEGQISDSSFLYDAAIEDLAGADSYYDGQTVQVMGEAVGEAIYADRGHSWVVLTDIETDSSVTVYMSDEDLSKIDTFGAYDKTGTTLRVKGTYRLACPDHDGESDIHASAVNVAAIGATHTESFNLYKFFPGMALLTLGLLLMALFWRMRERSR